MYIIVRINVEHSGFDFKDKLSPHNEIVINKNELMTENGLPSRKKFCNFSPPITINSMSLDKGKLLLLSPCLLLYVWVEMIMPSISTKLQ